MKNDKETYISFYLSSNTIRIFKSAIRVLGEPAFIQFKVHTDGKSMIVQPYDRITLTSFRVPKNLFDDNGSMEIHSKGLCRLLANQRGWNTDCSYRIRGRLIEQQGLAVFDLTTATIINATN